MATRPPGRRCKMAASWRWMPEAPRRSTTRPLASGSPPARFRPGCLVTLTSASGYPGTYQFGDTAGISLMFDGRVLAYGLGTTAIYTPGATGAAPGTWALARPCWYKTGSRSTARRGTNARIHHHRAERQGDGRDPPVRDGERHVAGVRPHHEYFQRHHARAGQQPLPVQQPQPAQRAGADHRRFSRLALHARHSAAGRGARRSPRSPSTAPATTTRSPARRSPASSTGATRATT